MPNPSLASRGSLLVCAALAGSLLLLGAATAEAQHPTAAENPLVAEAEELLAEIEASSVTYRELSEQALQLKGEERTIVALQMHRTLVAFMRAVEKL
ncbi:MAG: hypothetical protein JRG83_18560, partial [Deltaproteobacteria bacterium]|nr:hypothetical protein [Deltaproteobacteria bacterium]